MKKTKLIMIAAALVFGTAANAQKGGILIGGNFGINSDKNTEDIDGDEETTSVSTITFSPTIGYNISDKFMAGLYFDFTSQKTTYEETGEPDMESKSGNFGVGPFLRLTKSMGDVFSLYGQANFGINIGHSEEDDYGIIGYDTNGDPIYGNTKAKTTSFGLGLNIFPAIGVNCGSGWALNFSFGGLGFNSTVSEPDDSEADISNTDSNFHFGLNPQLNVGVSKTFGGGSK